VALAEDPSIHHYK